MDKLPFSVYDVFACLSSGFFLLAAVDYAFNGSKLLTHSAAFLLDLVLVFAAYTVGHVVAEFSSRIYERWIVQGHLGDPIDILLGNPPASAKRWRGISKSYSEPLPEATCERVRAQAEERQHPVLNSLDRDALNSSGKGAAFSPRSRSFSSPSLLRSSEPC